MRLFFKKCILMFLSLVYTNIIYQIISNKLQAQCSIKYYSSLLRFQQFSMAFTTATNLKAKRERILANIQNFLPLDRYYILEEMLYKQFVAQQQFIIISQMFSSGSKTASLKHETKTVTHRINCENQAPLNPTKNSSRGNKLMDSPCAHAVASQSRSRSKHKKMSANKLFAKAHQACDGETYLFNSKSSEGSHALPLRLSNGHCGDCGHSKKQRALELQHQYNIKIGGPAQSHSLSNIIGMFGFEGIGNDDLSSIQQIVSDSTLTSESASFLELIVKS